MFAPILQHVWCLKRIIKLSLVNTMVALLATMDAQDIWVLAFNNEGL